MTTTNRERREAVAVALMNIRYPDYDNGNPSNYDYELADAAINACLPDRAAFDLRIDAFEQAIKKRADDPCEQTQGEALQCLYELEMLVYGQSSLYEETSDSSEENGKIQG